MTRIWTTDADEFIVIEDYDDVLRRIVDAIASGIDDFLKFTFEDDTRCHIRVAAITAIGECVQGALLFRRKACLAA
jgi:hypothetical protein